MPRTLTANGYEQALSTRLLATHCCCCNRPLRDADSVSLGIGPICREKYLPIEMHYVVDQNQLKRAVGISPKTLREAVLPDIKARNWRTVLNKLIWHAAMAVSYSGGESRAVIAAAQQFAVALGATRIADRFREFYLQSKIKVFEVPPDRLGAKTPRNDTFIDAVKLIPGRRWHGGTFYWSVPQDKQEHLIAALSAAFGGEMMEDLNGNLVLIPQNVEFPPPQTKPAPGPDASTGESNAPPIEEIKKLRRGDKVIGPDGNEREIGWVGESRGEWRVGLKKKGQSGFDFYSYTEIRLIAPEQVAKDAAKEYGDRGGTGGDDLPSPPPVKARAVPDIAFPYQVDGISWLDRVNSGLLADEPGLGKTLQACVAADVPALVVCPAAMRVEWAREMNKWRPGLKVLVVSGRNAYDAKRYEADVVVVNYDVLAGHLKALLRRQWATVIADEAHYLKTLKMSRDKYVGSARAKAFVELSSRAKRRFLLTATPIMNRPIELWPLLHLVDADRWDSYVSFGKRYCDGYLENLPGGRGRAWNFTGSSNSDELHAILAERYMLRRTKDILPLPEKSRQTKLVALDGAPAKEYDKAAADFLKWVEEQGGPDKVDKAVMALALTKMTALRRLAAVGKVPYAVEWIVNHFEATGRPLVVMGHHRVVTEGIAKELSTLQVQTPSGERRLRIGRIVGGMAEAARTADKDAFQAGKIDVIVCSIQAAGVGLTLTAASETLFVERAWRPSDLVQAEDRIWRIGQPNKCTITYLDAAGTIDEVIGEMLLSKQSTIAGVIDGVDLDKEQSAALVFGKMFGSIGKMKKNPRPAATAGWAMASEF